MLHANHRQLAPLCLDSHPGPLDLTCYRGALHLAATRLFSATVEAESNGKPQPLSLRSRAGRAGDPPTTDMIILKRNSVARELLDAR